MYFTKFLILLITILSFCTWASGQIPQVINYQGKLTSPVGIALDGPTGVKFSIYSDSTGGAALWSDSLEVSVSKGLFDVVLGPIPLNFDQFYWVELKVEGEILVPRQPLSAVPYAIYSNHSNVSDSAAQVNWEDIINPPPAVNPYHFIWNQDSIAQTSANFFIGGDGTIAGGNFTIDSPSHPGRTFAITCGGRQEIHAANDLVSYSSGHTEVRVGTSGGTNQDFYITDGSGNKFFAAEGDDQQVGIGTINPEAKLHIETSFGGGSELLRMFNFSTAVGAYEFLRLGQSTTNWGILSYNNTDKEMSLQSNLNSDGGIALRTQSGDPIKFVINNSDEVMRVHGNGNVGIGTSSPVAKLDVNGYIVMRTTMIQNCGFESGGYTSWNIVSGGQRTPAIYQDRTKAPEGKYCFGYEGDHSSFYGTSDRLVWGIEQDIPNLHVITEASRFRFYTYGGADCQYHHWHIRITYTDASSTVIDNYPTEGGDSDWLATHGIPADKQVYLVDLYSRGATLNKTIDKIAIEIHKCHTGYTRYPPEVYLDGFSLFYE